MSFAASQASTGPTALPIFAATAPMAELPRQSLVAQVMGLPVSVHVRGPAARGARVAQAIDAFVDRIRADDATFSPWKPDSEVSAIRRGALSLDDAGSRVRSVAQICDDATQRTRGAFSAWLPGSDGEVRFDPTGLVKGWAVQSAFDLLMADLAQVGPHDALVSAGGDVVVACLRTDTPDWVIAIEDPRDRGKTLATLPLRSGAVATSGTAARGRHILDPATGIPASAWLSATVIGPSLTWSDVYATAVFVGGPKALDWLVSFPEYAALLVDADGTIVPLTSTSTRPGSAGA